MKNTWKRLLVVALAATMMLGSTMTALAGRGEIVDGFGEDSTLYITSEKVPTEARKEAETTFNIIFSASINAKNFGVDTESFSNCRLGTGFSTEANLTYCFPILTETDEIVAMVRVSYDAEHMEYVGTVSRYALGETLSKLARYTSEDNPATVVALEFGTGVYLEKSNDVLISEEYIFENEVGLSVGATTDELTREVFGFIQNNRSILSNKKVVAIGYESGLGIESSMHDIQWDMTDWNWRNVPFNKNYTSSYNKGMCWAMALKSFLEYKGYSVVEKGSSVSMEARLQKKFPTYVHGCYGPTSSEIRWLVGDYGYNIQDYGGQMSYSQIKKQIDNDRPQFTNWHTTDRKFGHSMVIAGYGKNAEPTTNICYCEIRTIHILYIIPLVKYL